MRSFTLTALASILAIASAVPLEKRVLVVETVTDVVVKTIDLTTTVYVKPSNAAHLSQHVHNHAHAHPSSAPAVHPQSQPEPQNLPKVNNAPAPAPAPAIPPTQEAAPVVPQPVKAAAPLPQPAAPVYKAPSPAPVPAPAPAPAPVPAPAPAPAPVPAPAPAPAPAPVKASSNSGSTANCGQVGQPCSGDITFYDTGLGACGWTNDGTSEKVFALAHGMMGAQSNGNPFCGRQAEITLNGKTAVGKLVDKCGGCEGQSIDLSHALFDELAPEAKGRISGVSWKFIS
ncbi:MAG: hypothetical protein LQ352_002182 [Teloschistes flavicans]|nr:MAG: hypothetical protein LQ352_002182 [Teloschistes flavicans]